MVAVVLVGALTLSSCGDGTEPVEEWEAIWRSTVATVTEASTADLGGDQCQDLLGYLRVQRTVLTPVPLEDLSTPFDGWFSEAEAVLFACDLGSEATQESLLTLEALEAEVDAVLEVEA